MDLGKGVIAIIGIIIVLVIIAGAYVLLKNGSGTNYSVTTTIQNSSSYSNNSSTVPSGSQVSNPVLLSDPPQAPNGVSAFVVSYSSVQVQTNESSTPITASGSGSVNLMSAVNSSAVIGHANITSGSTVERATIYVTSAYVIANGTRYNVTLPSQLTANVTGSGNVSQNSAIVFDITPVVSATYNQNTTSFTATPYTKAVVVANAGVSQYASVGSLISLNGNVKAAIMSSTPQITITSAAVSVSGNVTTINVTVNDNSNSTVTVSSLVLYGKQNVSASQSASSNASLISSINGGLLSAGAKGSISAAVGVGLNIESSQTEDFAISSYGSLMTPTSSAGFSGNSGTSISSGSSTTLTYKGVAHYDNGLYMSKVVAGQQYKIAVVGSAGATASTTVTAT